MSITWSEHNDSGVEYKRVGRNSFVAVYHFSDLKVCPACGKSHAETLTASPLSSARTATATRPQVQQPKPKLGAFVYVEAASDSVSPAIVNIAEAYAALAARELGIETPVVRWFRDASAGDRYMLKTIPSAVQVVNSGDYVLHGFADLSKREVWLASYLDRYSAAKTAAHECRHLAQQLPLSDVEQDANESDARAFTDQFLLYRWRLS